MARTTGMTSIRNKTSMTLKLHIDAKTAAKARDQKIVGICEGADVWILGHFGGKRHKNDLPEEVRIPTWLWDAVLAYDPPKDSDKTPEGGNGYQRRLIAGYVEASDIVIRQAA